MRMQSGPTWSLMRTVEWIVIVALVGLAGLALLATVLAYGAVLLPIAFILAIAAFAVQQVGLRGQTHAVIRDATAKGAPEPIVAWGKVASVAGACPDGDTPRRGATFVVAQGRVWPPVCRHVDVRILEAAQRMEGADAEEIPVRYQDGSHLIELDLYEAPAPHLVPAAAQSWAIGSESGTRSGARSVEEPAPESRWLPRAVISGFMATLLMSIAFFVAFACSRLMALVLPAGGPGSFVGGWLAALTTNPVLDLAASGVYVAGMVHVVVGVVWGLLYAAVFEPRLSGSGWQKGMKFALLPWMLSLVAFFPLVGGGILGFGIGAGPLPALGNLLLHLVYGATLGSVYGPLGDIPADQFPRTQEVDNAWTIGHEEQAMGRGIVIGALLGAVVGLGAFLTMTSAPSFLSVGVPPSALFAGSVVLGATFGCFIGSITGLSTSDAAR